MASNREPFNGERTIVDQTCDILNDIVLGRVWFCLDMFLQCFYGNSPS